MFIMMQFTVPFLAKVGSKDVRSSILLSFLNVLFIFSYQDYEGKTTMTRRDGEPFSELTKNKQNYHV